MFEQLFTQPATIAHHHASAYIIERRQYLTHLMEEGRSRNSLRIIAELLISYAQYLPLHRADICPADIKVRRRHGPRPDPGSHRVFVSAREFVLHAAKWLAGNTDIHPGFAGVYVARVDKKAPSMSVSLGVDGTATVTEDPGTGSITSFGHWASDGSQIKVTFNADAGEPAAPPMVFQVVHNKLQAVTWNHEAWGNAHPPAMEKGYKVKYLFWTTTMP